ncbi:MAG TPA: UPF0164 family protein, partial [Saprospiraceae bacterium]|nr:UPF0164 family protein [Saprospiraceae bacterium]
MLVSLIHLSPSASLIFAFLCRFLNIIMMEKRHQQLVALSVLLLLASNMFQNDLRAASRAKYAGEFISIGVGGRALGLGGAYTAIANDVTAGYWNPAGLSKLMYPEIILMHDERFAGLENYDFGALALPLGVNASLGISVIRMGIDDIHDSHNGGWVDLNNNGTVESNEVDYSKLTFFNSSDWAFYFSYAKKTSDRFSYGANLKFLRREQGDASATGVGFDLAAQYQVSDNMVLAANVQDITTTLMAWNTGTNELISPTLKIGSAYFVDALGGRFAPAVDVDIRFENRQSASNAHLGAISFDFHGGLEFE